MGEKRQDLSRREEPSVGTVGIPRAKASRRKKVPVNREYVGIHLHRRRSVVVRKNCDARCCRRSTSTTTPMALAASVSAAGPNPEVELDATFGWYWAAECSTRVDPRFVATRLSARPKRRDWSKEEDRRVEIALAWSGPVCEHHGKRGACRRVWGDTRR